MHRSHVHAKHPLGLLAILALLCLPGSPEAEETPVIRSLLGAWEGNGTLFGSDATFRMEWEWVLQHRFVRLAFENRMQGDSGERVMQAMAFYEPREGGSYEGTWFDSRGVVQPLEGEGVDSVLTVLWGTPDTEQGRTVYRVLGENEVEVEDAVLKGDTWHTFGRASYSRSGEPGR